ncbi:hypothetical protein HJFPF1_11771 [Paramyrothecium foliicola]|nr:hypothetical protein HJFPF1_11771 [Paramyrothecium foliicola]
MDPTTATLFTFLLQTDPQVQTVHLIGSWDNFTSSYTMERDVRRGRDQWKGCYSFKDVSCHDSATDSKGNGGLKMGHTYYYYYEVDGSTETYDPAMPSTTACPYLPGQTLNTLTVPEERTLRHRTASMSSMRHDNYTTLDPQAKYITPRQSSHAPVEPRPIRHQRLGSAPAHFRQFSASSSRSPSPAPAWKRIFNRKMSTYDGERGRSSELSERSNERDSVPSQSSLDSRSVTPSDGVRTRDMSPESLSRFLKAEDHSRPSSPVEPRSTLVIPEEIVEENEDDDNFASSAASEAQLFPTCLSPPPVRRASSHDAVVRSRSDSLAVSQPTPLRRASEGDAPRKAAKVPLTLNTNPHSSVTFIHIPPCIVETPYSPLSPLDEVHSYDSNDDDDVLSSNDEESSSYQRTNIPSSRRYGFMGYSLPQQVEGKPALASSTTITMPNSPPPFLTRGNANNFLGSPIDTGLDDFISELGWAVQNIGIKQA